MTITETQKTAQLAADAAVSAAEAKQYMLEAEKGYQDTSAAAQQAQDAAGSALLSKQSAATSETNAAQSAEEAEAAKIEAAAAAANASDYAKNKFTFYKTPTDPDGTIAGLAATTDGQSFWVAQGPDALSAAWQYQNKAGVAVLQAKQPGTAAVTGTIREFPTLEDAQADADAGNILVGGKCWVTDSTGATLAVEYVNNAGTLTATGRKMPSYDSLKRSNILFDAFNEQSAEQLTFASWDWYKGATPAFSTADVNLPLPTPVIQASGVTSFDKYYDVSKLQVKPGDTLAFSVLVWFENAGGKLQIYWLDSAGATITTGEASPLVAGISSPVVVIAVPSGASSIRIRVQNTVSGAFKIG
ncbi:TPA: hypothetical protein ACJ12Z_005086, partial [Klebsiella pneumoniae]